MVRRFAILAACLLSPFGLLMGGIAHAAPSETGTTESREVWLQPVLPAGSTLDARSLRRMVDDASDWADRASDGRWRMTWGGVRPVLSVEASTCAALAREVALDRQRRAQDTSITLYVGDTAGCPYRGIAQTPGSWVVLPRVTAGEEAWARTIAHEFGHTIGLQHAGAQTCAVLSAGTAPRSSRCVIDEYGDRTDPMGRGSLAWSLGPLARASLGWAGFDSVTGDGEHDVTLAPEGAVMITDPMTGARYAVAYRVPGRGADARSRGVHLYRLPTPDERDVASVHLPWIASPAQPWGGRSGMAFLAPSRAVSVGVVSVAPDGARVRITIDEGAAMKDRWGPVFIESRPTLRGGSVRIPRAFDQSGVARYVVRMDGRVVDTRRAHAGLSLWTARVGSGRHIVVEAIDAAGNRTAVRVR